MPAALLSSLLLPLCGQESRQKQAGMVTGEVRQES